jgi:hypothetical protein
VKRSRDPKGNPVGSREAKHLSQRCEEVLVGTILGDGCLERNGINVRLRIDHSLSQQAFVDWKRRELEELNPSLPRVVRRVDSRTGTEHQNYRFSTRSLPVLNRYFQLFHGDRGRKVVPRCISALLRTPLSLAVWYMDDGGRRRDCRGGYLNTNAYSAAEVALLQDCLRKRFDLSTAVHFAAGKPRIYIPSSQFGMFCELIRPHVIGEMLYKLL